MEHFCLILVRLILGFADGAGTQCRNNACPYEKSVFCSRLTKINCRQASIGLCHSGTKAGKVSNLEGFSARFGPVDPGLRGWGWNETQETPHNERPLTNQCSTPNWATINLSKVQKTDFSHVEWPAFLIVASSLHPPASTPLQQKTPNPQFGPDVQNQGRSGEAASPLSAR